MGPSSPSAGPPPPARKFLLAALCIGVCVFVGLAVWFLIPASREEVREALESALLRGEYEEADRLARVLIDRDDPIGHELAFQVALAQPPNPDLAVRFRRLTEAQRSHYVRDLAGRADWIISAGRLTLAETLLTCVLETSPDDVVALDRLTSILALQGRRREIAPLVGRLIDLQKCTPGHLLFLCSQTTRFDFEAIPDTAAASQDVATLQVLARRYRIRQDTDRARELLENALRLRPDWLPAHAELGALLVEFSEPDAVAAWHATLPDSADNSAPIWEIRGTAFLQAGQPDLAARCFLHAVEIDPDRVSPTLQLTAALNAAGLQTAAEQVDARAQILARLAETASRIHLHRRDTRLFAAAARDLEKLGRHHEARGWWLLAHQLDPNDKTAADSFSRLQTLAQKTESTLVISDIATVLPEWTRSAFDRLDVSAARPATADSRSSDIQLVDRSAELGVEFGYFSDFDPSRGRRMLEFTGGGVGILDFDQDGWPDLYFCQGTVWPPGTATHNPADRLFRNVRGTAFRDVTGSAGVASFGYGQGLSVGDVNADGFPDVFVANHGRNVLLLNAGDGTFHDATAEAGLNGGQWTTSCALVDLNGDALPDLFEVNYVGDAIAVAETCQPPNGRPNCTPHGFEAVADRLWLNSGDGRFEDVTRSAGIVADHPRGLGVVIADFDGVPGQDIFVANDDVPNHLYLHTGADQPDGTPLFQENGLIRGVAVNDRGASEACMGIAADDIDRNGLIDLFVTNFHGQSNTLLCQLGPGLFSDRTRHFGLSKPGLAMLGFGAQFADLNLDGWRDLIVVNGHVHDDPDPAIPLKMRPQCFLNNSGDSFAEVSADSDTWLNNPRIGRALALTDWNRDGLMDCVATYLDGAASIVDNRSARHGTYLSLRLIGTGSERSGVGAKLRLTIGDQTRYAFVPAGNGYQCSNERRVHIGLGSGSQVDELTIEWPSGSVNRVSGLDANAGYVIVEGREDAPRYVLPE